MKKSSKIISLILSFIVFFIAILLVAASFLVPKYALASYTSKKEGTIHTAPSDYYLATNTLMAKQASANLSSYDRIQLVTGSWSSSFSKCDVTESEITEIQAVNFAKEKINALYSANLFPVSFFETYNNWYSWETSLYQYTDTVFYTYTAYLWHISFQKYDGSSTIDVYLTDNGVVLSASITPITTGSLCDETALKQYLETEDNLDFYVATNKLSENSSVLIKNNTTLPISFPDFNLSTEDITSIVSVDFSSNSTTGTYLFYQYQNSTRYGIGVTTLPAQ